MTLKSIILAVTFIACTGPSASATSIVDLLSTATAVIIGHESNEMQQGNVIYFSLTVERNLSGPLQVGQTIAVQSDPEDRYVRLGEITSGLRGIWFLKQAANGSWLCIPASHSGNGAVGFREFPYPIAPAELPIGLTYDDKTTPLADKLLLEVAAGYSPNPGLLLNAASGVTSSAALRALRFVAETAQGDSSLYALSALIQGGDVKAIEEAEKRAQQLRGRGGAGRVISAISLFRNSDPLAVASLGRMAESSGNSPELRMAAAKSLAAIHSPAAVPALGAMLSEPTPAMQLIGARGLSFFVNGIGVPTSQASRTLGYLNQRQPSIYANAETEQNLGYASGHEESFIQFWVGWWGQHPELH